MGKKWGKKNKKFSAGESNTGEAENVSETQMMAQKTQDNYIDTCTL